MKFLGKIENNDDIVNKKYVDDKAGTPYVISTTAPSDTTKLWIRNGAMFYFDSTTSSWRSLLNPTDVTSVSVN